MPIETAATDELIVSTTNTKPPTPWWLGLSPDQQDELLNRIDPQRYGPGQKPPMTAGRWNREKRRVRRARERWIEEIAALRTPCQCDNCRRNQRPPFPRYYVVRGISYECWLEQQTIDPEMAELLEPLRNDREHKGAVNLWRTPAEINGIFRASR